MGPSSEKEGTWTSVWRSHSRAREEMASGSVCRSVGRSSRNVKRPNYDVRPGAAGGRAGGRGRWAGGRAAKEEVELESADLYNYRRGSRGGLRESEVLRAERSCHRHREIEETS